MIRKCKTCGAEFDTIKAVNAHKTEAHGWVKPQPKKTTTPAMELLHSIDKQLKDALSALEQERDTAHRRLLELDTEIANVKTRLRGNGH